MAPRICIRRKGDDIFLTVKGGYSSESLRELLAMVRQLFVTSLKCAAPGSEVNYSFRTRGKVNLDKMSKVHEENMDRPYSLVVCGDPEEKQQQGVVTAQGEPPLRGNRRGFILIKGGALKIKREV